MLLPSERTDIQQQFALALAEASDQRATLRVVFNADAAALLLALPTTLSRADEYSAWVVDYCLTSRWLCTPSMMEQLLDWLVQSRGVGRLQPQLARVKNQQDPLPDPYMARWLLADQPFFDRDGLRPLARRLVEQPDRPFLWICGPQGSGRSYTREYFDYLRDKIPGVYVVQEELPEGSAPSYRLRDLVDKLTSSMMVCEPRPAPDAASAYPAEMCRWFLRTTMQQRGTWIFVLDGFGQQDVDANVISFIDRVAQNVRSGEERRRIKLVLIDYTRPFTRMGNPLAVGRTEAVPDSSTVNRSHVIDCLIAHNKRRKDAGRPELEQTELGTIADNILGAAPVGGRPRLEHIYGELLAIASMDDNTQ